MRDPRAVGPRAAPIDRNEALVKRKSPTQKLAGSGASITPVTKTNGLARASRAVSRRSPEFTKVVAIEEVIKL